MGYRGKKIVEGGGFYKKGKVWYVHFFGGPDQPIINVGPNPYPDPRPVEPLPPLDPKEQHEIIKKQLSDLTGGIRGPGQ